MKPENQVTRGNQHTFSGRSYPQPEQVVESRVSVKFAVIHMEYGLAEISSSWIYLRGGNVQKSLNCVFVV